MILELPFPPSVNHIWRRVGNRTVLSRGGRAFRRAVQSALAACGVRPMAGRLAIIIDIHPPDKRRRDLDNMLKALLDALQHGGAYADDSQIDDLHIRRGYRVAGGQVRVRIAPLVPHPDLERPKEEPKKLIDVPGGAGPRKCLKCNKIFHSDGPGNRICGRCSRSNVQLRLSESEVQRQRGAAHYNGELLSPGVDEGILA